MWLLNKQDPNHRLGFSRLATVIPGMLSTQKAEKELPASFRPCENADAARLLPVLALVMAAADANAS